MSDEFKAARDARSVSQVDLSSKLQRDRWAQALGVTAEALESAVKAVGTRVDRIKDYLGAGGFAGEQQDA